MPRSHIPPRPKSAFAKPQLVIGRKPLLEILLSAPEKVERIYVQSGAHGEEINQIIALTRTHAVPLFRVPATKLQRLTMKNHQGVIGFSALIEFVNVEKVIEHLFEQGETPLLLIVDEVTDVGNLGAMARTAWISGFHAIVLPYSGVPAIQEGAIKASAGALQHINVCRELSLAKAVEKIKLHGLQVVAAALKTQGYLKTQDFTLPTAVVMGNEEEGIGTQLLEKCDATFTIPMQRQLDSYNVSVAFGMIAYEAMMQRM